MPEVETTRIAPALKALLHGFIDYAGLFPPAKVELGQALRNYDGYKGGDHNWMLRWFVVGGADIDKVPADYDGALSILGDGDNSRAAVMESTKTVSAGRPVYCEIPLDKLEMLEQVKAAGNYAKIRTGGLKPEAIPAPKDVAAFIIKCAQLKLPFKATAGLHHPIRSEQPLTYEADAPRAVMHGFINVLMAAAFAYHGEKDIQGIIEEMDPRAFSFDDCAHWQDKSLTLAQIEEARQFIHSVGSCSFDEPVQDLEKLGLL